MNDVKSEVAEIKQKSILIKDDVMKVLQQRSDDYEYCREMLYRAEGQMSNLIDVAMHLAEESEHPRAVEVASNAVTQYVTIVEKFMKLHLDIQKITGEEASNNQKAVTTNNLNVKMTSADVLEILRGKKEK